MNLDTHLTELHRWLVAELNGQVLDLRMHCAALRNAALPAESEEDAAVIAEAAVSFEQVVGRVPVREHPLESLRQHAHDMRNPLSAVIGFSQYLRDATGHPSATAVYRVANHILFTIDSLTYYARAKANDLESPMLTTPFDLLHLARSLAQQASLEMILPEEELEIVADRVQIHHVLMTLAQTANHIATDSALLMLTAEPDDRAHLTFRFPSVVDVASLAVTFDPDWTVKPGAGAVWEVGLCAMQPLIEGHRGGFEIVAVAEEVQFALALPLNVRDTLNSWR